MLSYTRLLTWAIIWLFTWIITSPLRKNRHNCLTYAMERWDNEDGYLVVRWCRNSRIKWLRWPHFGYLAPKYHTYIEHAQSPSNDEQTVPQIWFDPIVKRGDLKEMSEEYET